MKWNLWWNETASEIQEKVQWNPGGRVWRVSIRRGEAAELAEASPAAAVHGNSR